MTMRFRWQEILGGNSAAAPNWTLAGRTDEPVSSRGEGAAAVVQRLSQALNSHSVNYRIQRRKRELQPILEQIFGNHARGGVLVVACIEIRRTGEMEGSLFQYMTTFTGVYRIPDHAIGRWRREPRLESPANGGRMEYRFFWVTRA
jgi:hypothetical protein